MGEFFAKDQVHLGGLIRLRMFQNHTTRDLVIEYGVRWQSSAQDGLTICEVNLELDIFNAGSDLISIS